MRPLRKCSPSFVFLCRNDTKKPFKKYSIYTASRTLSSLLFRLLLLQLLRDFFSQRIKWLKRKKVLQTSSVRRKFPPPPVQPSQRSGRTATKVTMASNRTTQPSLFIFSDNFVEQRYSRKFSFFIVRTNFKLYLIISFIKRSSYIAYIFII